MVFFTIMFSQRRKGVKITDQRVRLTTEVLQGIRLLKFYAWETFYTGQISNLREGEIRTIKKAAIARSALVATMLFSPILASILSFVSHFAGLGLGCGELICVIDHLCAQWP